MPDIDAESYPPQGQWTTDPIGRRYWVAVGPTFGFNPLVSVMKRLLGSTSPAKTEVGGRVTVTRVEGDQQTEVLEIFCDTWAKACDKAQFLADQIEAGRFQEQPCSDT